MPRKLDNTVEKNNSTVKKQKQRQQFTASQKWRKSA